MTKKTTKYLTVRLDDDLLQRLAELADINERTTSSEARLAIRLHLDELAPRPPTPIQPARQAGAGDGRAA